MSSGTVLPMGFETLFDSNGDPVAGGLIWTYIAGTLIPQATYKDAALTVSNTNPIVADAAGRWTWFGTPGASYKFIYQTAAGVTIVTPDNISTVPQSAANLDIVGTAGESLTAGQVVYLSDGSGGKVAGLWYKADNANGYSSTLAVAVGMVPASIATGASGTVRLAGQVPGLTVVTGTRYYVGTAGALTSTAPVNARVVGGADSATSLILAANPGVPIQDNAINDFRLTLTTGVPVTTADVLAATTVFWTPYQGNRVTLFDAAGNPTTVVSAQLSIALPAVASQVYDVFVYNNAGTPALELLAWTNDTTRATALALATTGGYTKTGDLTRRYVGSVRTTTVAGQTEDSLAKRYVFNAAWRLRRPLRRQEVAANWTYTLAAYHQANANAANQVEVVVGLPGVTVSLVVYGLANNSAGGCNPAVSIGEDSTTVGLTEFLGGGMSVQAGIMAPMTGGAVRQPAIGRHFYAWLESSTAVGTTTWYTSGFVGPTTVGLLGWIDG